MDTIRDIRILILMFCTLVPAQIVELNGCKVEAQYNKENICLKADCIESTTTDDSNIFWDVCTDDIKCESIHSLISNNTFEGMYKKYAFGKTYFATHCNYIALPSNISFQKDFKRIKVELHEVETTACTKPAVPNEQAKPTSGRTACDYVLIGVIVVILLLIACIVVACFCFRIRLIICLIEKVFGRNVRLDATLDKEGSENKIQFQLVLVRTGQNEETALNPFNGEGTVGRTGQNEETALNPVNGEGTVDNNGLRNGKKRKVKKSEVAKKM